MPFNARSARAHSCSRPILFNYCVCLFQLFIRYYDAQLMVPRAICSKPYLQVKLELSIRPVLS